MFQQYFQLGSRIRKHYLSPRVLLCLMTGQSVPPIHRKNLYSLQYSMLPARRAGVWDMWRALTVWPSAADGMNGKAQKRGSWPVMGGAGVGRRDRSRRGYNHH